MRGCIYSNKVPATINTFFNDLQNTVSTHFNGTILEQSAQEFNAIEATHDNSTEVNATTQPNALSEITIAP